MHSNSKVKFNDVINFQLFIRACLIINMLILASIQPAYAAERFNVEIRTFDGKCLDIPGSNTANGVLITTYTCHGGKNQRWDVLSDGQIKSRLQGNKCIDVPYSNPSNGTRITTYTCHGGANQKWIISANNQIRTMGSNTNIL